jgi:hypothetical protein
MSHADIDIRELILRRSTPVVINCFNQLTYVKNMVEKLWEAGFRNLYVLDQASTYPPLREWLADATARGVIMPLYLPQNKGPHHFFLARLYDTWGGAPVIYSDPDMSWDRLAPDFLSRMFDLCHRYRVFKAGPALAIPSIEDTKPGLYSTHNTATAKTVAEYEAPYWEHEVEPGVYNAPIDTTMHLFIPQYYEAGRPLITGLRVAGDGYSVQHLPWYRTDPMPADEYAHYLERSSYTTWRQA